MTFAENAIHGLPVIEYVGGVLQHSPVMAIVAPCLLISAELLIVLHPVMHNILSLAWIFPGNFPLVYPCRQASGSSFYVTVYVRMGMDPFFMHFIMPYIL